MADPNSCMCPECTLKHLGKLAAYAAHMSGGEFRAPVAAPPELLGLTFMVSIEDGEVVARVLTAEQSEAMGERAEHGALDA